MSPYVKEDYREILRAFFSMKKARSGIKSEFAKFLSIKTSYLSQVLSDKAHLTSEQVYLACQFFQWNENETEYMLLCAQKDRSKDTRLKQFYLNQIKKLSEVAHREAFHSFKSSEVVSQTYYRSWLLPAIHEYLLMKPSITKEEINDSFDQPRPLVEEALSELIKLGVIRLENGKYHPLDVKIPYPENQSLLQRYLQDCRKYTMTRNLDSRTSKFTALIDSQKMNMSQIQKIIEENLKALESKPRPSIFMLNLDLIQLN